MSLWPPSMRASAERTNGSSSTTSTLVGRATPTIRSPPVSACPAVLTRPASVRARPRYPPRQDELVTLCPVLEVPALDRGPLAEPDEAQPGAGGRRGRAQRVAHLDLHAEPGSSDDADLDQRARRVPDGVREALLHDPEDRPPRRRRQRRGDVAGEGDLHPGLPSRRHQPGHVVV